MYFVAGATRPVRGISENSSRIFPRVVFKHLVDSFNLIDSSGLFHIRNYSTRATPKTLSHLAESNRGHRLYERRALPTELRWQTGISYAKNARFPIYFEPEERIGLSASILPRWRSTTELLWLTLSPDASVGTPTTPCVGATSAMKRYYHATGYSHNSSTSGATIASLISSGLMVAFSKICISSFCADSVSASKVSRCTVISLP